MKQLTFLLFLIISLSAAARNLFLNPSRGFGDGGQTIAALTDSASRRPFSVDAAGRDFSLNVTVDNLRPDPDRNYRYTGADGRKHKVRNPAWQLSIGDITLRLAPSMRTFIDDSEKYFLSASLTLADSLIATADIPLRHYSEGARQKVILSRKGNRLTVNVCVPSPEPVAETTLSDTFDADSITIEALPGAEIKLLDLAFTTPNAPEPNELSVREINERVRYSSDHRAGYYRLAGADIDRAVAIPGGDYVFAVFPSGAGCFDIRYIAGARTCPDRWRPGMLKGRLTPAADDNFSLLWFAADGKPVTDAAAFFESADDIRLSFPLLSNAALFIRRDSDYSIPASSDVTDDTDP